MNTQQLLDEVTKLVMNEIFKKADLKAVSSVTLLRTMLLKIYPVMKVYDLELGHLATNFIQPIGMGTASADIKTLDLLGRSVMSKHMTMMPGANHLVSYYLQLHLLGDKLFIDEVQFFEAGNWYNIAATENLHKTSLHIFRLRQNPKPTELISFTAYWLVLELVLAHYFSLLLASMKLLETATPATNFADEEYAVIRKYENTHIDPMHLLSLDVLQDETLQGDFLECIRMEIKSWHEWLYEPF